MKKIPILVAILFISTLLTAQILTITDSISWQNSTTFIDSDKDEWIILSFDNAYNRSMDNLPVYFYKTEISGNAYVDEIELVSAKYEAINKDLSAKVKNIESISNKMEVKSWISVQRKNYFLSFELLPIRENPLTGELEKLVNFEYRIHYKNKPQIKNSKSFTYDSELSSGTWYKIAVQESGMYKITHTQLVEMGFTSFSNIGVFGYGGMLPKTVGEAQYDDLPERPIYKVDANLNSAFDSGDFLLFYADGPHNIDFDISGDFSHEYHSYSDYSYYFVSDKGSWESPNVVSSEASFDTEVTSYDDYVFLEKDSISLLHSGRQLFWREFDYYLSYNFIKTVPNVLYTDSAEINVMLAARSNIASYFNLTLNGTTQNQIDIGNTTNSSLSVYAKTNTLNTFKVKPSADVFDISISYVKTTTSSKGWLDYISIKLKRDIRLNQDIVIFRDIESVQAGTNVKFKISNASSQTVVWDITDRANASKINGDLSGSQYSFNADASELREYIAFNPSSSFPSPQITSGGNVGLVQNQNLHALSPVDLIIVAHPDFYSQAEGIKGIHEEYDNMSVILTTPQKIYNEFSSGTPDVSAIRNFMKMFYDRAATEDEIPDNLFLVGDGSYDNFADDASVSNFILTYESESSLAPTSSFVSDDFYVFLDDGEGSVNGSHDIDVGVGRLPVKSSEEATGFLNKLRAYYSPISYGDWKNRILLVADDAEGGETIHQTQSNTLATQLEMNYPQFNLEKLFLDDFEQISTVQGHKYPDVNQAITDNINNGVLVVNWIGHGNEKGWAHESVLTLSMITTWQNENKYPIFVTATCEFSPWDHHTLVSGGEEVLLNPTGGGIALFTTTRLAFSSSNASLSYAFYERLFTYDSNGKVCTIGQTAAKAKNSLPGDTNKRVFALLGDPAMRPSVPEYDVATTKINGVNIDDFADTIQATSMVTFEGVVKNPDGTVASDFNGVLFPTVYDKFMEYETRGNDGYSPLQYRAQKNIIFKGQSRVTNGYFTFSFIVPIDIAYFYDSGKVSYYGHNNTDIEAGGYNNNFTIGGSSGNNLDDDQGPDIELFMNNLQFIPGGITDESPMMLAQIADESGINTVGSGIGHDITLIFDEHTSDVIVLNKFYESTIDDFTSGEVNYPMTELSLGPHTLKVKAWDVLNNSSESVTDFIVANSAELVIDHLFNYPNPFSTSTEFYFDHNQPNQSLDVVIQIFTISGKHVKTIEELVLTDGFRSQGIHWDGKDEYGDKIGKGVYVYKVKVRTANGNVVDKFEKLVVLN